MQNFKRLLKGSQKRILGIDFGEKRIGLAITDAERILASPFKVTSSIQDVRQVILENDVGGIVAGLPLLMDGLEGETAKKARVFGASLADLAPVEFVDERLSSSGAERMLVREADMSRARRRQVLDKVAAQHILATYLGMCGIV